MRSHFRIRAILLEMDVYIIHRVTGKLNDCTYDEHQKMSRSQDLHTCYFYYRAFFMYITISSEKEGELESTYDR